jgi:hypothetical protein
MFHRMPGIEMAVISGGEVQLQEDSVVNGAKSLLGPNSGENVHTLLDF